MNRIGVVIPKGEDGLCAFVQICDRRFERTLDRVVRKVARTPDLKLIGLTGPTCAGKTTAANKLTDYLEHHGHRVHVISIDDFYFDKEYLNRRAEEDPDIEIDYDSESTIDVELLSEKAESLLSGQPTEMPKFDFQTGTRVRGETIDPQPEDVFLFEGIQILYPRVNQILCRASYQSIYICPASELEIDGQVFVPNELRLMRRLVRDYYRRASKPDFTFYLWESVRANEEKNIFPNAHRCHEFIDSTMAYEVGMLKPHLQRILAEVSEDSSYYGAAQQIIKKIARVRTVPSEYMTANSLYKEFI